jgi:hypothetical protein
VRISFVNIAQGSWANLTPAGISAAFSGISVDAGDANHSMVPNEDWMTIVFDPVAAKTQNPDFDPTAVLSLGAIFATGDKGDTTPGTVTFYIDQIDVASAK